MANIEVCLLKLKLLGYKARMLGKPPGEPAWMHEVRGDSFVVRCKFFTVEFSEKMGIIITTAPAGDALEFLDWPKWPFSIRYPFENQSGFFSLGDDAFVECVVRHVGEAVEVVSALPGRLRPG